MSESGEPSPSGPADRFELEERQAAIKRRRGAQTAWAVFSSIGVVQLLFASFAIGASYGPVPLHPFELLVGFASAFAVGAAVSWPLTRRRLDSGARLVTRVTEGRRSRRIVIFAEHLMIGEEIVVKSALSSVEVDDRALVLRYRDPRYEGAVLRELSGDRRMLARIAGILKPERTESGAPSPLEPVPESPPGAASGPASGSAPPSGSAPGSAPGSASGSS